MFGHASLPSINMKYHALPPHEGAEVVNEQMRLGHVYRNALVQAERERRDQVHAILLEMCPDVLQLEGEVAAQDALVQEESSWQKGINQVAQRCVNTRIDKDLLKGLRAQLKALRVLLKAARTAAFDSGEVQERLDAMETIHKEHMKELRATSGLHWGTYLSIEQACSTIRKGAPPKFMRYRGDGRVVMQLQGGLTLEKAFAGRDTRLQLRITRPIRPNRTAEPKMYAVEAKLRVGTLPGTNKPLWTTFNVTYHRPLPEGSLIKWAMLHRRRVGCDFDWRLTLTVSRESGFKKTDLSEVGAVGVDIGWRLMPTGIRAAYWVGSDGEEGEVIVPNKYVDKFRKVNDLRGIRDRLFDDIRLAFQSWLDGSSIDLSDNPSFLRYLTEHLQRLYKPKDQEDAAGMARHHQDKAALQAFLATEPERVPSSFGLEIPEWLTERLEYLIQWKSPARLASVVLFWRDNRFEGDEIIYGLINGWRKQDKHLYQWQENLRKHCLDWREDQYKRFAAIMRKEYHEVVVEDVDLAKLRKTPEVDEEPLGPGIATSYRDIAAPGRLRQLLLENAAVGTKADSKWTTMRCCDCDKLDAFDAAKELVRTCRHCSSRRDQDQRAAYNLLAAAETLEEAEVVA